MSENKTPVRKIRTVIEDSGSSYVNRILIGTAMTGLLRSEWVAARYSQSRIHPALPEVKWEPPYTNFHGFDIGHNFLRG